MKDQAAYALNAWCAWLDTRGIKLLEAGRRDFRKWMDERTAEGVKASTRRKEWFYVSAFYTNAAIPVRKGGLGLLAEDPMDTVRGPKVSGRPTTRTAKPDEVDALVAYFSQQASLDRAGGEAERARRNVAMADGESIPCAQWIGNSRLAGFTDDQLPTLHRIMWLESRCDPNAYNPSGASGLVQVMSWWARACGITPAQLFDPTWNLVCARHVYETQGWTAWSTYR